MKKTWKKMCSFILSVALLCTSVPFMGNTVKAEEIQDSNPNQIMITTEEIIQADSYLDPYEFDFTDAPEEEKDVVYEKEGASVSGDSVTAILPEPDEKEWNDINVTDECDDYTTVSGNDDETGIFGVSIESNRNTIATEEGCWTSQWFKVSGMEGPYKVSVRTLNTTDYKLKLSKNVNGWPTLEVTGISPCTGYVLITATAKDNAFKTASKLIRIVVEKRTTITADSGDFNLISGQNKDIEVTYECGKDVPFAFAAAPTRSGIVSVSLDKKTDSSAVMHVKALNPGTAKIKLYLKNTSTGSEIMYKWLNVQVTENTSMHFNDVASMYTGENISVIGSVQGNLPDASSCAVTSSNNAVASVLRAYKDKNKKIHIDIRGLNAGTTTMKVELKLNGYTYASTTFQVTVKAKGTVIVTTSAKNVKLKKDSSTQIPFAYMNTTSNTVGWECSVDNDQIVSLSWGSQNGNKRFLNIFGKQGGTAIITVRLLDADKKTIYTIRVPVEVSSNLTDSLSNLSYSFENFGKSASWDLVKYMYGNDMKAQEIYDEQPGEKGNCFGMAITSGMFYVLGNGISASSFRYGVSNPAALKLEDRNTAWNLNTEQFIQCGHMIQYSSEYHQNCVFKDDTSGIDTFVKTACAQINQGYPIKVGFNNSGVGHAVIAYAFDNLSATQGRLYVYDSNYPKALKYIYVTKDNNGRYYKWNFNADYAKYGFDSDSGAVLTYSSYNDYVKMWNNRKNIRFEPDNQNLMVTNSENIEISDYSGNAVAKVVDGVLISYDPEIEQRFIEGVDEDRSTVLYLPDDLYRVKNEDTELEAFEVSIASDSYATSVKTKATEIALCADDSEQFASATLIDGMEKDFDISISCIENGKPTEKSWKGTGESDVVGVCMNNTEISTVGIGNVNEEIGLLPDPNVTVPEIQYGITAVAGEGGTITPAGITAVKPGESKEYKITANDGFEIENVIVDGVEVDAVSSYTFEKIQKDHEISVTFVEKEKDTPQDPDPTVNKEKLDLKNAEITLDTTDYVYDGTEKKPRVSVKMNDKVIDAREYNVSYTNNLNAGKGNVTISALETSSSYTGSKSAGFEIKKAENQLNILKETVYLNGKTKKQTVNLKVSAKAGVISYSSNVDKVKVDHKGKVTIPAKFSGDVAITVTASGDANYEDLTRNIKIVVPKSVAFKSVKNSAKKTVTVKWKKEKNVKGYQIQYSLRKDFKNAKIKTIKNSKTTFLKINKLKANKKYYFRIRTYGTEQKKKYYSNWSNAKKVTIKK